MFGIHPGYLIVLLAVILIVFGPGKLPEVGGAIGRATREFRKASEGLTRPEPAEAAVESPPAAARE